MRKTSKDQVTKVIESAVREAVTALNEEHDRDISAIRAEVEELAAHESKLTALLNSTISALDEQHRETVERMGATHGEAITTVRSAFSAELKAISERKTILSDRLELMENDEKRPKLKAVKSV